ncbi:MAG: alpha/beta hydrolase family protein [Acidimicrobiales bacterium]
MEGVDGRGLVSVDELTFGSGDRTLAGSIVRPAAPSPAAPGLLFVHGLRSTQNGYRDRAQAAATALGVTGLTFDLSGHGRSTGNLAELRPVDHLDDIVAACDMLLGAGVDAERVGVCAASYGAFLSCLLVARRKVRRLLLRAPGLYGDEVLGVALAQPLRSRTPAGRSEALEALAQFDGEVMILESERDELIDHSIIQAYLAARPDAHHEVLAGATHALSEPGWRQAFLDAIVKWFAAI